MKYGPLTPAHRTDEAMERFRNYGLGQFIHWGLYAIPGNEWEGVSARKGAAASEWIRTWSGPTAPKDWKNIYDNLYKNSILQVLTQKAGLNRQKKWGQSI
ncbi:alpha-L-fucosidase [Sphingobacterium sp. E70]|uniref:alpha-L-fucosidase n=1 Tax=Sphingobacterium sp. E70 TaxID=2853439 RepID=UPI00211CCEC4|nr:alpha-L-fucosidase [Sphingobacterium sp. E70]